MRPWDRYRRIATVALSAGMLVASPQIANAVFGSTRQPSALNVGTAALVAPTAVVGTFTCGLLTGSESITFAVTGFADTGPLGSTYTYAISRAGVVKTSVTSLLNTRTLSWSENNDNQPTSWTLSIQASRASWTGPAYSKTVSCTRKSDNTGSL